MAEASVGWQCPHHDGGDVGYARLTVHHATLTVVSGSRRGPSRTRERAHHRFFAHATGDHVREDGENGGSPHVRCAVSSRPPCAASICRRRPRHFRSSGQVQLDREERIFVGRVVVGDHYAAVGQDAAAGEIEADVVARA